MKLETGEAYTLKQEAWHHNYSSPCVMQREKAYTLKLPRDCPHLTASKVMLETLQARLQQYMNRELPDVQACFRKGRGSRDQTANIRWIIKIARVPENIYFCFIDYAKAFDYCGSQ